MQCLCIGLKFCHRRRRLRDRRKLNVVDVAVQFEGHPVGILLLLARKSHRHIGHEAAHLPGDDLVLGHINSHGNIVVFVFVLVWQDIPFVRARHQIVAVNAETLAVPVLGLKDRRRPVGMTGPVVHAELIVAVYAARPSRILKRLQLKRPHQVFRIPVKLHSAEVKIQSHEVRAALQMQGPGAVRTYAVSDFVLGSVRIVPGILVRPAVLVDNGAKFIAFARLEPNTKQFPFVSVSAESAKRNEKRSPEKMVFHKRPRLNIKTIFYCSKNN